MVSSLQTQLHINIVSLDLSVDKMIKLKLEASDGTVMEVPRDVVKQMGTIYTMLDSLHDDESDEVIPVKTISGRTLQKVVKWILYHECEQDRTKKYQEYSDFFNTDIENIFKLIAAADYLDVNDLLNESCRSLIHSPNKVAGKKDLDKNAIAILEDYKAEHGYEVIVTIQFIEKEHVKYYNLKVSDYKTQLYSLNSNKI